MHARQCYTLAHMTTTQTLPHWDLSNVFGGLASPEFQAAFDELAARLDALDAYLDEHRISRSAAAGASADGAAIGSVVSGLIDRLNDAFERAVSLRAYVTSFVATDSFNDEARRWQSRLEGQTVRLRRQNTRFEGWLGQHAADLPRILADPGAAREHAFYLQEAVEQSRYLMSEPEESLAAELSLSGDSAWSKLQGNVASQVMARIERDGRAEILPITAIQNLGHDPDPALRRQAYEVELAAWETVREPLAAALNGVKGFRTTLNRRRGRADALHTALDDARIDRATLDALLGSIRAALPSFRRYLRYKARRLGHDALPWWDLHAPVVPVGLGERHFSYAEARRFILDQFGTFSPSLAALAERAFDQRWIDAEPRRGKRGGAFCMNVPAVHESRILCNFDGSLDQVFTIAHELGHAYHNHCLRRKRLLQTVTPMTLAETASTLCETIVTNAALAAALSPAEELSILETYLIGATGTLVDITSRFYFEQEVFERREQAELSADDFCEIMLRWQREIYGDGLDPRYLHKYMWAWKPHYYRPELSFYNFPYAFGMLFGTGLYALFRERGPAFVPDYEALLASTGEAAPADLAARFGIDLRQPAFWQSGLQVIEARIERYVQL
jgi:pepF/M3 family oligoendopeptidase